MMKNIVYTHLQELQHAMFFLKDGARPQAGQHTNLLISISKTDGLAVLVPYLGHPDH
jgi:hypothetical protein